MMECHISMNLSVWEVIISICKPLIDIMSHDNQSFERGVAVKMLEKIQ